MRSHSELIQVMLDHINLIKFGLCRYVNELLNYCYINRKEANYLHGYLKDHLPVKKYSLHSCYGVHYSFPIGDIPSREKWLREQL